ncbi:hypothetical protein Tco_0853843 [Tanacetum coccineum]
MGDENLIRTLGDYSRPSHEGYRNTIELLDGNNVVPLRSDTIRLVKNGCSFNRLRSEDPNQHLKDFLKLVESLDLDVANRKRTRLRTAKLENDILMFQQHQGESFSKAWTYFKDLLQKVPYHGIDLWLQVQIFYDHVNPATRKEDESRETNAMESHASNDMGHNIIIKVDKKVKEGLNSFETVIEEDELRDIKRNGPDDKTCGETKEVEEVEVKSKVSGEEIEEETKEEEEDDPKYFDTFPTVKELRYHEWLLNNPRPAWVIAKVRIGNLNNIKISCMIGHFLKRQAYIDLESPINVMSKLHYHWIMSNFTYECDFVVLEDTTSVIDHYLGEVVFGKPFIRTNGLVYDKEKGTIMFEMNNEKITFKMPHKMERFSHIDFEGIKTDSIPPFVLENDNDHEKTYYSDSLILRPEYKQDESVSKEIQHLMKLKSRTKDEGGVT